MSMVDGARTTKSHDDQDLTDLVDSVLEMTPILECDRPAVDLLRGAVARRGRVEGARRFVESWVPRVQARNNYVPDWALQLQDAVRSAREHNPRLCDCCKERLLQRHPDAKFLEDSVSRDRDGRIIGGCLPAGHSGTLNIAFENEAPFPGLMFWDKQFRRGYVSAAELERARRINLAPGCEHLPTITIDRPVGPNWTPPNQRHDGDGNSFCAPLFEKTSALFAGFEFTGEPPPMESPVQSPIMRTAPPCRPTARNACADR